MVNHPSARIMQLYERIVNLGAKVAQSGVREAVGIVRAAKLLAESSPRDFCTPCLFDF
jgi:hypothetical protein